MEHSTFKKNVKEWLEGTVAVNNAIWTIEKTNEPKSVIISVSIRETFQISEASVLTREIKGASETEDSEEAIRGAVLALNDKLLNLL